MVYTFIFLYDDMDVDGDYMNSYMCPDCGERVDDTITVRGVFGEDEVCPYCHGVNE